jgi:hypothetical protein
MYTRLAEAQPRRYVRHGRAAVRWLAANYTDHSLRECAAHLGLSVNKVKYLLRSHKIRKRAPNGQRWCGRMKK